MYACLTRIQLICTNKRILWSISQCLSTCHSNHPNTLARCKVFRAFWLGTFQSLKPPSVFITSKASSWPHGLSAATALLIFASVCNEHCGLQRHANSMGIWFHDIPCILGQWKTESSAYHVDKSVAKTAGILEVYREVHEVVFGRKALSVQKSHDLCSAIMVRIHVQRKELILDDSST